MARSSPSVPDRKMNGVSGRDLARHLERRQAVEARQREIGQDEVGLGLGQRAPQHGLGIHALPGAGESTRFELPDGDFRLARHVLDENQSYRLHLFLSPRLVSRPLP